MREIKFRAWSCKVTDNRHNYAYEKSEKKVKEPQKGTDEWSTWYDNLSGFYEEFYKEWDSAHSEEEAVSRELAMLYTKFSINGEIYHSYGYEIIHVMQFTGLRDKNGKEIYEGDILKKESFLTKIIDNSKVPHSDHVNYYLVEFNSDKKVNGWQLKTIKTTRSNNFGLGHISSSFLYTYTDKAEIIGNIYENPELLP